MSAITRAMRELSGNEATKQLTWHKGCKESLVETPAYLDEVLTPSSTARTTVIHDTPTAKPETDWISSITTYSGSTPALMLNELYQSYLGVDHAIYQASSSGVQESWNRSPRQPDLDIHSYLASTGSPEHWQIGFAMLTQRYSEGILASNEFKESLEKIMASAERLEEAQESVENYFEQELESLGIDVIVPESFWAFVEARSRTLEDACMKLEEKVDG